MCFVDFKKAFDSISHDKLWVTMMDMGYPIHLIDLLAWMDNIKTWTGLSVEESIRMTEDRDKWRKYVHGVANPRIEDG